MVVMMRVTVRSPVIRQLCTSVPARLPAGCQNMEDMQDLRMWLKSLAVQDLHGFGRRTHMQGSPVQSTGLSLGPATPGSMRDIHRTGGASSEFLGGGGGGEGSCTISAGSGTW